MAKDESAPDIQKSTQLTRNKLLDEKKFKRILDIFPEILDANLLFIRVLPKRLEVAINTVELEERFPDIPAPELGQVIDFVSAYAHYIASRKMDAFYARYPEEERKRAQHIVDMFGSHKNAGLLIFRCFRTTDYIIGPMEAHTKYVQFISDDSPLVQLYDISIPSVNGQGEETILRLELDRIELQNLITALTSLLEEDTE